MENSNISPCKEDIKSSKKKIPLKETKILQALQNSIITNLKFQHKPKISGLGFRVLSKNPHIYLLCSHSEHPKKNKNQFRSKQSKTLSPKIKNWFT